jgi:hypothetical protein
VRLFETDLPFRGQAWLSNEESELAEIQIDLLSDATLANMEYVMRKKIVGIGLFALISVCSMASAQVPGPHPAYLHALSDLRAARHYLNDNWAWEPVRHADNEAIREIDAAIAEIKRASIDDGKGLHDPFPIDTHLTPRNRFHKATELLLSARNDLSHAEDMPSSRGLRDRAIGHVNRAHQFVDEADRTAHWE